MKIRDIKINEHYLVSNAQANFGRKGRALVMGFETVTRTKWNRTTSVTKVRVQFLLERDEPSGSPILVPSAWVQMPWDEYQAQKNAQRAQLDREHAELEERMIGIVERAKAADPRIGLVQAACQLSPALLVPAIESGDTIRVNLAQLLDLIDAARNA